MYKKVITCIIIYNLNKINNVYVVISEPKIYRFIQRTHVESFKKQA